MSFDGDVRLREIESVAKHSILNRRQFLAGGLTCGLAAFASTRLEAADATRPLTIAFGWVPNSEYADIFVAMEKGHFANAGLSIKYLGGGPNAPVSLVSLAAGQADIAGTSWLQLLDAASRGNDFVIIASMVPVTPEGLISLPRKPILKPADLSGGRFLG